jgi:hypothetical protein
LNKEDKKDSGLALRNQRNPYPDATVLFVLVLLQQDNTKPHTAAATKKKCEELELELLPHPAYSPDLAPSDYYLFRSMAHFLN